MKKIASIVFMLCLASCTALFAQGGVTDVNLNATNSGDTITAPDPPTHVYDDGGENGRYEGGHDYYIVVQGTCDSLDTLNHFTAQLITYDIACEDTLYIYDGPNTNAPLLQKINNCYKYRDGALYTVSPSNTSRMLTIRFRTTILPNDSTPKPAGFYIDFNCVAACENVHVVLDTTYERTDKYGNILSHHVMTQLPETFDTIWEWTYTTDSVGNLDSVHGDDFIRIDTISWVDGALLCLGQGIILHSHCEYSSFTGWYQPADSTSLFGWRFGNADTLFEIGAHTPLYTGYKTVDCYDVTLDVWDEHGCKSLDYTKIQVRIAQNPIKTIYDLTPICNVDSQMVNVGYDGDNGTLTLRPITFIKTKSKTNMVRTFIPDGPRCDVLCYEAPVTFDDFPSSKRVTSAADICSICVNYEHSFMGDYALAILCPTYDPNYVPPSGSSLQPGKATLKYKNAPSGLSIPEGTAAGGGMYTGMPYMVNGSDDSGDHMCNSNDNCDSVYNPYGLGFNYCFSLNGQYMLKNGMPCNTPAQTGVGLGSSAYYNSYTYTQPPIPAGYCAAGQYGGSVTHNVKDSSDHEGMADYYLPGDDFSTLVGCPLNGTWNIQICDSWSIDNGWVFSWSMDICGVSAGGGCEYQVGIDSVVWRPDTNYATDFRDGLYRGLQIHKKLNDSTTSYILSPDTAGDFRIRLSIYDEFGCRWDTLTHISTVYTPEPNLGNDTVLCDVNTMILDARDKHSDQCNYLYAWDPFGEDTPTIETTPGTNKDYQYVVEVLNREKGVTCHARDTIFVSVNDQPIPSFDPGVYPLEGCEPFTINIVNTTKFGYKYRWVFGDGTYSTLRDPSHSYSAGQYDFKYYVESEKGCKDSLIFSKLITVHPSPKASFSWDPVFPTVQRPSIQLHNNTSPDDGNNKYFWEIQYDKNNPYSFHTLTSRDTSFEWSAQAGEDVSGNYAVRLIARSDNRGPSGILIQCTDTVENNITIVNDMLQFPTVITPNGDGINDRFVIANLVEGLAYPINTLDIYDKWGSRVFHATNISRDDQFWDPSRGNIPAGSYFYRFSGKGYQGNIEHNGVVEVLK